MPGEGAFIQIRELSKSYGGVRALDDISFDIAAGEVHALCGENGAGKSTLNKILSGSVVSDSGEILLDGQPLAFGSVQLAEESGIAIVHQEPTVFLDLDSADNVFIRHEPAKLGGLWLDRSKMIGQTKGLLERLGESFDPTAPLRQLSPAQRQMVSIARAISRNCRLLILDEPTASLSKREVEALFAVVRKLKESGVSVLYVSHRLEEVFELAERVTVLRDGHLVATRNVAETTKEVLIRLMVGRELGTTATETNEPGPAFLQIHNLTKDGAFEDISFELRSGEVVALAALVGAGRSEVARAIFGVEPYDSGQIDSGKRSIAYLPEDRQNEGLHLSLSVRENVSLAALPKLSNHGFLDRPKERRAAEQAVQELGIRTATIEAPVESLSGGNQQKTLLGKWLATDPEILILDEPTRGVDVGAKAEIHRKIRELSQQQKAILVISSELPEVLALGDRILVMRQGRISGELSREEANQEKILELALPVEDARQATTTKARQPIREWGLAGLLLLLVVIVGIVNPAFLAADNLRDMLVKVVPAAIVACGLTFVVLSREIDISVGSMMGLCSAALGIACSPDRLGLPPLIGVAICLGVGLACGLLNGILVAYGKIPSIIATLGMLTILNGITELLLGGKWITSIPPALREFGTGSIAIIPYSIIIAILTATIAIWLASRTPFGRRVYALGSNPMAAGWIGLPSKKLKLAVFGLTGLAVGIAALFSATQLQVIESGFGKGFELTVVAAVVVGGVSIRGGRGSVSGALLGAVLLGVVSTMLIFLKLGESSTYWERAIQGALILVAVLSDHFSRRKAASE